MPILQCLIAVARASHASRRSRATMDEYMKRSRAKDRLPGKQSSKADSTPFHRELSAMQTHYARMSSALDWKDPGRVRSTACHVARAWLDMEAAFIRFIERPPAGSGLGSKAWRERFDIDRK